MTHQPTDVPTTESAIGICLARGTGADLVLRLDLRDGRTVTMPLGPAEYVALACELLAKARLRVGRENWPGRP